jgi:hypothetical protein
VKASNLRRSPESGWIAVGLSVTPKVKPLLILLAIIGWVGAFYGCGSSGKPPFQMAQVCLRNADNLAAFSHEMQIIAHRVNSS